MQVILFFQSTIRKSWRQKLTGVHLFAQEHDWLVQVIENTSSAEDVRHAVELWKPAGCMVDRALSSSGNLDQIFPKMPLVYLDLDRRHISPIFPTLIHDSAAEAIVGGRELLTLNCASYAYIRTKENYFWDQERHAAFAELIKSSGKPFFDIDRGKLASELMKLPKPCGILAANDRTAVELHLEAIKQGLNVPDDIAICGIDNDETYCLAVPNGLTSVEPDFLGAGYKLAKMLHNEIKRFKKNSSTRKPPEIMAYGPLRIIRRGSTKKVLSRDVEVRKAIEFIAQNATKSGFGIDNVCKFLKCSRKLATERFRKATGHTILDEIQNVRFDTVKDLLQNSNRTTTEIVFAAGYSSESYPKKRFLEITGLTMKEWRSKYSISNNRLHPPFDTSIPSKNK